jgi:CPA2 family monovalent cation:H+ antiporter-2
MVEGVPPLLAAIDLHQYLHDPGEFLIFDVVIVLAVGVLVALFLRRFQISAIVGYLVAGIIVGPHGIGLVQSIDSFPVIADLGVALLLFTIGLELSWSALRHSSRIRLRTGLAQVAVTIALVTGALVVFGEAATSALVFGAVIAMSSTAVVLRVLIDRAELDSAHGHAALAMLLAQDLVTIVVLLMLPSLADPPPLSSALVDVGILVGKLFVVVGGLWLADRLIARHLFTHVSSGGERELVGLLAIVVALGAAGFADVMGISPALGAFVAGLIIGEARYGDQVRAEVAPLYTALLVLFFAYVGMLADLGWMVDNILLVLAVSAGVVATKTLVTSGVLRAMGTSWRYALLSALAISQLGEFSLVIATQAAAVDLLSDDRLQLVVSVVLLTLLATPTIIDRAARWAHRPHADEPTEDEAKSWLRGHGIVVGYGPAGKRVADALEAAGVPIVVIDLNATLLRDDETRFAHVVNGDAGRSEILDAANVRTAGIVVLTVPEQLGIGRVVAQIRALAPDVPIVARGRYHVYLDRIREAGVDVVVDEESTVGEVIAQRTLAILDERNAAPANDR